MDVEKYREEFERNCVKQGDCLVWTGSCGQNGIGRFMVDGKYISARRAAWVLSGGLLSDRYIHLSCSNQACVNPDHLVSTNYQGGHKDEDYGERLGLGQGMIDGEMDEDVRIDRVRSVPRRGNL